MKPVVADYRYRVLCLRIQPKIGAPIRLTHHPRDLMMSNGFIYRSGSWHEFTGYSSSSTMSPAVMDMRGAMNALGISHEQLASGVFDNARAYLFATTWNAPIEDEEKIVASLMGKATDEDGKYTIEEMALVDGLNQNVGDTYTPLCNKRFGGQEFAGCKKNLVPLTVTGTITAVTSATVLRDAARTEAVDWFAYGTLRFTSGQNATLKEIEVKRYEANGTIEVFEPFFYLPQVGDSYTMIPGCRKRQSDCSGKWNNIVNFGGFSYVPTSSQYGQIGAGGVP